MNTFWIDVGDRDLFNMLTDAQAGLLLKMLFDYALDIEVEAPDDMEAATAILFEIMRRKLDAQKGSRP